MPKPNPHRFNTPNKPFPNKGKSPAEIPGLRNAKQRTFLNPDGTMTAESIWTTNPLEKQSR